LSDFKEFLTEPWQKGTIEETVCVAQTIKPHYHVHEALTNTSTAIH